MPTTEASWPSSRSSRSAGPLSAAPAMIGDTATPSARRAIDRVPHARARPARDRSTRSGSTARSPRGAASPMRLEHARRRARAASAPSKRTAVDRHVVVALHEVLLEADLPLAGHRDPGLQPVVGDGEQAQPEVPGVGDLGAHLGEGRARPQAVGAVEVGGEVAVAEVEPRAGPRVASRAPPSRARSRRRAPSRAPGRWPRRRCR